MSAENEAQVESVVEETEEKQKEKKKRTVNPIRRFPYYSIEEILKIPKFIKDQNGGNPWSTEQLAKALNVKKGGNTFYYTTAASRDYGFTIGTRDTENVELTELGRKYAYAQSQEDIDNCIKIAFSKIEIFQKVYDYYNGTEPSEDSFFKNALFATFNIEDCFHDEFINIYRKNVKFINNTPEKSKSNVALLPSTTRTTGATKALDKKVFVIMPFTEKTDKYSKGFFKEVFGQLIQKSAEAAGYIAETADRDGSDIIQSTIVKAIVNANIIIADLTEHNPNVLFELGIAIALRKPVVLIKSENTGQIFDIDNTIRVFSYNQNLWPSTIEKDVPNLAKRIRAVADSIGKDSSYFDTFMGTSN